MSETKWYCQRGTDQFGPLSDDELKEEVIAKRISGVDLLWHAGLPGWVRAVTIDSLFSEEWQFESAGKQVGPVTLEQLREEVRRGHIHADALVWSIGLTAGTPASKVLGLFPSFTVDAPLRPNPVAPNPASAVASGSSPLVLPAPRPLSVGGAQTSSSASVDALTRLGWYVGKNWETHYRSVF